MQIKCPHCEQLFDLSEDAADKLRNQVRNKEFEDEIHNRMQALQQVFNADLKSAVSEAVLKERESYETKLNKSNENALTLQNQITELKSELNSEKEKANSEGMKHELELKQRELEIKQEYADKIADMEANLKAKDHELDYYKDYKSKMSTKMVGETLEKHCEIEFNKIRMAAFPKAEFGKDNVISKESGSKGDYIFREYDDSGVELVSIMFEMKNEMETTATKKTNEHFLKELDKDRREKNCEYAVLVTLLEADNDLYNQGIVDVSYLYPKMYVIRPQFFIPIITLLRNAAVSSLDTKVELMKVKNQNLDVAQFKANFDLFKKGFGYNYEQAGKRLNEAVEEIDKAISRLKAVRDALTASDKQLTQANKKVDDITIEKLCKQSPLLLQEFEKLEE